MESKRLKLEQETFSCCICRDPLNDPVIIPCGHSYCMKCITRFWDNKDIYCCPLCRQTFTTRPVLVGNAACDVSAAATATKVKFKGRRIRQSIESRERDNDVLQRGLQASNHAADKAAEDSEEVFTELIRLMEKRRSDVKQQIRSQQEAEASRVKAHQEKVEQEVSELKELLLIEDREQRRQKYYSLISLSEFSELPRARVRPPRYVKHLTAAVSEVRDILQGVLAEKGTKTKPTVTHVEAITNPHTEPRTRAGLLKHSRQIHLDPNTASSTMLLSEGNSRVTIMAEDQSHSSHPDRFYKCCQVLSEESLTGRCYWEVEWSSEEEGSTDKVSVAVAYKTISRIGYRCLCLFGLNENSWSLEFDGSCKYKYTHNKQRTPITGPWCNRVGVFLDHDLGILAFYSITETTNLICRVQTRFTEPLHAGLGFDWTGGGAHICDLKEIRDIE